MCVCVASCSSRVVSLLGWRCAGSSYAQTTLAFVQVGQPSIWLQTWTCAHTPATNVDYRRMQCGSSKVDDRRKHRQSHIDFFYMLPSRRHGRWQHSQCHTSLAPDAWREDGRRRHNLRPTSFQRIFASGNRRMDLQLASQRRSVHLRETLHEANASAVQHDAVLLGDESTPKVCGVPCLAVVTQSPRTLNRLLLEDVAGLSEHDHPVEGV